MAIIPGASVKSKFDLTRSEFERKKVYPLQTGTNFTEEGSLMIKVAGTSSIEVAISAGAAAEVPLGVALLDYVAGTTFTRYETGTVPAAAPYTVTLERNNLIDVGGGVAEAYVYDSTAAAALTVIAPGAPAATQVAINTATGVCTFNVAEAGNSFFIRYRYTMTTTEAEALLHSSHINRGAVAQFSSTSVGYGRCVVYTTNYDARGIWTLNDIAGANRPVLGAGGRWSTAALTAGATQFGRVISLPSADDPYLGLEYVTPA